MGSEISKNAFRLNMFCGCGKENAIHLRDLARLTGVDSRTLRELISADRKAGVRILSDNCNGYYWPADEFEIVEFSKMMTRRGLDIVESALAVKHGKPVEIQLCYTVDGVAYCV